MNILATVLSVYESGDPPAAFHAMGDSLLTIIPLRCALRVSASDRVVHDTWPAGVEVTPELLDAAVHVLRPEIFPLGSEFPSEAGRFPASEMLLLPLRRHAEDASTAVLIADEGAFGEDLQPWEQLARALERIGEQHRRVCAAERECEELRQRAEESEALHTLGLAANRTLDPDEVLNLVARFTRTLLGAHYVTVHTSESGLIQTVATVGVWAPEAAREDYLLARRVVEAEKPLTVGEGKAHLRVADFPFHTAEGMRIGLGIPLSLFGETFGALIVGYRRECTLTPRDTRLALTLAGHAAVAISNARLHCAVEDRSRELERAYEELNKLTHAKERFYNAISHDLRTPIGAVKNYNELLLEGLGGELPPKARRYLENSRRAAESLLALVNDLLDFAKLDAGKMEVQLRPCTLAEIVEDALAAVRPQAEAKDLRISSPPADTLPFLQTDPKRVRQILVNLFSNAVKFTREGEVTLTVTHVDPDISEEAGNYPDEAKLPALLEIRVADTGPGIAPENLGRIFQEFEQVQGSEGTGLGLPISQKLARLLGGDLLVESEVSVGSTFVLRLPVAKDANDVLAASVVCAE